MILKLFIINVTKAKGYRSMTMTKLVLQVNYELLKGYLRVSKGFTKGQHIPAATDDDYSSELTPLHSA